MSAKDYAVQDIREDLKQSNKSFIAFRRELNPVMRKLVSKQIRQQQEVLNPFYTPSHAYSQLVARCFFAKGRVTLNSYFKYYK